MLVYFLYIFTSLVLYIFTSFVLYIFTSFVFNIFTSFGFNIFTSFLFHIFISLHLYIFTSFAFLSFCIFHFSLLSLGSHKKKKVHPLVAGPLRPYPPPSSLMAIGTFFLNFFFLLHYTLTAFIEPQWIFILETRLF